MQPQEEQQSQQQTIEKQQNENSNNSGNGNHNHNNNTKPTFNLKGVKVQHIRSLSSSSSSSHHYHNHSSEDDEDDVSHDSESEHHHDENGEQLASNVSSSPNTTSLTPLLTTTTTTTKSLKKSPSFHSNSSHTSGSGTGSACSSCGGSSSSEEDDSDDDERVFKDPKSNVKLGVGEDHVIVLPHHHDRVNHFALDIGGSLVKMVYYEAEGTEHLFRSVPPKSPIPISDRNRSAEQEALLEKYSSQWGKAKTPLSAQQPLQDTTQKNSKGARICFARFKTADIEDCLSFIESLTTRYGRCDTVHATGGGSFKFSALLERRLGIKIKKLDEMESLIAGLNFLLKNIHDETFIYKQQQTQAKTPHSWMNCEKQYISFKGKPDSELYPYLLVNIGSGVSILRVTGNNQYERVSGSSVGGGTFWGLGSLLTGCVNFEDLLDMTMDGDNRQVDMLVGDIYGRDYAKVGLRTDTIASTFGKAATNRAKNSEWEPNRADVAKSLLFMICNNIGQIAYLNAIKFGLKRIYFAGYFIRDHPITMYSISYAIDYWSRGQMQALFLKHEGYLGAIGSFFNANEHNFIADDEVVEASSSTTATTATTNESEATTDNSSNSNSNSNSNTNTNTNDSIN